MYLQCFTAARIYIRPVNQKGKDELIVISIGGLRHLCGKDVDY